MFTKVCKSLVYKMLPFHGYANCAVTQIIPPKNIETQKPNLVFGRTKVKCKRLFPM